MFNSWQPTTHANILCFAILSLSFDQLTMPQLKQNTRPCLAMDNFHISFTRTNLNRLHQSYYEILLHTFFHGISDFTFLIIDNKPQKLFSVTLSHFVNSDLQCHFMIILQGTKFLIISIKLLTTTCYMLMNPDGAHVIWSVHTDSKKDTDLVESHMFVMPTVLKPMVRRVLISNQTKHSFDCTSVNKLWLSNSVQTNAASELSWFQTTKGISVNTADSNISARSNSSTHTANSKLNV